MSTTTTPTMHEVMQAYSEHIMYGHQRRWMRSVLSSRYTAILACRQVGKSWTLALASILLAHVDTHDVLIISESQAKAQNIIREVLRHLQRIGRAVGESIHDPRRSGASSVTLRNGRTITARPGQPHALQGFSGSVIVDEMSITRHDPEMLLAQALSVSSADDRYRIIIASNADTDASFVHRFFFPPDPASRDRVSGWAQHTDDIYSCLGIASRDPDLLPEKFKNIKSSMNPRLWRRYYENQFLTAGNQRFDTTCLIHTPSTGPVPRDATVTIGYDPGYTINPSGVVVLRHGLDKNEPYAEVLLATRWYQMPVSEQQERILALVEEYGVHRVVMDAGGAEAVAQGLRPRLGKRLVEQQVTPKMLRTTADTIDYLISRGRLAVPDPALRAEIGQVELDGENIHLPSIVPSPRPNPKAVDHSDMYVGLALASTQVHRPSTPTHTPTSYVRQASLHRAATVGRR